MKSVVSKILRDTRLADTSLIPDIHEWIVEAMDSMRTQYEQIPDYADIDIVFHRGKLPCGLLIVRAVEYKCHRLRYGLSSFTPQAPRPKTSATEQPNTFQSIPKIRVENPTSDPNNPTFFNVSAIVQPTILPEGPETYELALNIIQTSFPYGKVRVHYFKQPTDEEGFPLIPDNHHYKEAIYWYCRGKIIGCGYQDPVYNPRWCDEKYELYAGRAIEEITYPSPDKMESVMNNQTRLIPPTNYYDSYFGNAPGEQFYGYDF